MKKLHLVLKHKWYNKIESGEKTSEYRECKPYWNNSLLVGNFQPYEPTVHNMNGLSFIRATQTKQWNLKSLVLILFRTNQTT